MLKKLVSLLFVTLIANSSYSIAHNTELVIDILSGNKYKLSVDNQSVVCTANQLPESLNNITNGSLSISEVSTDNNDVLFKGLCSNNDTSFELLFNNNTGLQTNIMFDFDDKKANIESIAGNKFSSFIITADKTYEITNIVHKIKDIDNNEKTVNKLLGKLRINTKASIDVLSTC